MWEGDFNTYKTCRDCESIRNAFFCDGWWYGMVLENLSDHINDTRGAISEDCISGLTPVARTTVCELIEKQWD